MSGWTCVHIFFYLVVVIMSSSIEATIYGEDNAPLISMRSSVICASWKNIYSSTLFSSSELFQPDTLTQILLHQKWYGITKLNLQNCSATFKLRNKGTLEHLTFILIARNNTDDIARIFQLAERIAHDVKEQVIDEERPTVTVTVWKPRILLFIPVPVTKKTIQEYFSIAKHSRNPFPIDSQVYIISVSSEDNDSEVVVSEIYRFRQVTFFSVVHRMQSNLCFKNIYACLGIIIDSVRNTRNKRTFGFRSLDTVAILKEESYLEVRVYKGKNQSVNFFGDGLAVRILEDLQTLLQFRSDGSVVNDYTVYNSSGIVTGIGKRLLDGDADLSVSLMTMVEWRLNYFRFLHPVHTDRTFVFFQQPPSYMTRNLFVLPFRIEVHCAISLTILGFCLALLTFQFVNLHPERNVFNVGDTFLTFLSITCTQGFCFKIPACNSKKLIILTALMFSLTINIIYSAVIVSSLTLRRSTVQEFSDFVRYQYKVVTSPGTLLVYKTIMKPEAADKMIEDTRMYYHNESDTMNKILSEDSMFASISSMDRFYYIQKQMNIPDRETCKLDKFSFGVDTSTTALSVRKGSPYRQILNSKILILFERGLRHLYVTQFQKIVEPPCAQRRPTFQPLRLADSKFTLGIMTFGILLAILTFIFERIAFRSSALLNNGALP